MNSAIAKAINAKAVPLSRLVVNPIMSPRKPPIIIATIIVRGNGIAAIRLKGGGKMSEFKVNAIV